MRFYEKVSATTLLVIAVGAIVLGLLTTSDQPSTEPYVGSNGPTSVSLSLALVHEYVPALTQQAAVEAELAACTDLHNGVSYTDTAADIGQRFDIQGQLRDFVTTTAVDTFCFDLTSKVRP